MVLDLMSGNLNKPFMQISDHQVFDIDEIQSLIYCSCSISSRFFLLTDPLEVECAFFYRQLMKHKLSFNQVCGRLNFFLNFISDLSLLVALLKFFDQTRRAGLSGVHDTGLREVLCAVGRQIGV